MDALSFVLGVQSRDLRSSQMKDLVFRPPNSSSRQKKLKASASIYYETPQGETIQFQRTISSAGVGDYRVNGSVVLYKEYEARLGEIGVLVKARNFLVFQGDVESLARKTPAEFVELLEQISLSAELKEPYEQALKAKEEAEADTLFSYHKQKGMKTERRILKEQKEEAERFDNLLHEKARLQADFYLWQLFHVEEDRKERENNLQELQAELQEKTDREQEQTATLKEAKKKASAARRQTQTADKHRVQLAAEVDKLEPSQIQVEEELKTFEKKIQKDEAQLEKKTQQASMHSHKLKELEDKAKLAKKDLKDLEEEYEEAKKEAAPDQVTLTHDQEEEYERVREAAAAASVQPRRRLATVNKQLESARARAANLASQTEGVRKRKAEVSQEVNELKERSEKVNQVRRKEHLIFIPSVTNQTISYLICSILIFSLEYGQDRHRSQGSGAGTSGVHTRKRTCGASAPRDRYRAGKNHWHSS